MSWVKESCCLPVSLNRKANNELSCISIIVLGKRKIKVLIDDEYFEGILNIPKNDIGGLVIFVHGSGSSSYSSRNEYLAEVLNESRISTFLINLLSVEEKEIDNRTKEYRFNINLLAKRLLSITDVMIQEEVTRHLKIGYFGSSTGTAVAVMAAGQRYGKIVTIVSRSGRPDLLDSDSLRNLRASILLLVGGKDELTIDASYKFLQKLNKCSLKKIITIPGATHLFAEDGKIQQVGRIASGWFTDNLAKKCY